MPIKLGNTYPEARDAVLLQRNSTVQPVFQRGIWTRSGTNKIATFTDNPDFNVQSYSFAVTLKRLQKNTQNDNYVSICNLAYYTSTGDNFMFGVEDNVTGSTIVGLSFRLNKDGSLVYPNIPVGQSLQIVGIYNGTFGTIYYGSNSISENATRPSNTRPRFKVNENHPDYEVTNYGWWLRELTIKEKNDYMNGNMKAFQTPV